MKKLMLATVSSLALGLAGIGVGYAQTPANTGMNPPSTTTPATPNAQNPVSPQDQGSQANQATPGVQGTQPDQSTQGAMNTQGMQNGQGMQNDQSMQGNADMSAQAAPSRTELRQAQQQLRAEGLYRGRIDGRTGPRTRQAIMAFQQQHNLNATGTLDQQTLQALQSGNNRG